MESTSHRGAGLTRSRLRHRIAWGGALLLLLTALTWILASIRSVPRFQGRPMSQWIEEFPKNGLSEGVTASMGPAAARELARILELKPGVRDYFQGVRIGSWRPFPGIPFGQRQDLVFGILESLGPDAAGAVPVMRRFLRDASMREVAARVILTTGTLDPAVVDLVEQELRGTVNQKMEALNLIGICPTLWKDHRNSVQKLIRDPVQDVSDLALRTLVVIDPAELESRFDALIASLERRPETTPLLDELLDDALKRHPRGLDRFAGICLKALRSWDSEFAGVPDWLGSFGPAASAYLPALEEIVRTNNFGGSAAALKVIRRISPDLCRRLFPIVVEKIDPLNFQREYDFLAVVEEMGNEAQSALPKLRQIYLADPDLQFVILGAIASIDPNEALPRAGLCVRRPFAWGSQYALRRMGTNAASAASSLRPWLGIPNTQERLEIAATMQALRPGDPDALQILRSGLASPNYFVRRTAVRAIQEAGCGAAFRDELSRMGSDEWPIRNVAREILRGL